MATVNRIEKCDLVSIAPAESRVYRKTNTRRVQRIMRNDPKATIPDEADVASVAQYQIECKWQDRIYDPNRKPVTKCDLTNKHSMVFLSIGEGTGRPNGAKILVTPGAKEAYAILSWSDLFGYSIKENQLGSKRKDVWLVYAIKLTESELNELQEALYQAGVDY